MHEVLSVILESPRNSTLLEYSGNDGRSLVLLCTMIPLNILFSASHTGSLNQKSFMFSLALYVQLMVMHDPSSLTSISSFMVIASSVFGSELHKYKVTGGKTEK